MYGDRTDSAFQKGVAEFVSVALEHRRVSDDPMIFCPCLDYSNVKRWTDIHMIEDHLYRRGFGPDYETWYWHGEDLGLGDDSTKGMNKGDGDERSGDDIDYDDVEAGNRIDDMMDAIGEHLNNEQSRPRMFEDVSNA